MKNKRILILAAVLLAAVLSFDGCKESDPDTCVLTVIVSEGVSGLPASGSYTQNVGQELQYSFSLNPGYSKLTVLFDGVAVSASGKITLSGDHTLQAYSDDNFQCALTVTLTDGVTGTPAAGTFNFPIGTVVDYSYAVAEGYYGLTALLDDSAVDASGSITMSQNHVLQVGATKGKEIRGNWELVETYDDDSAFTVTATFSGGYSAGTVTDSDGGSGTYSFEGSTVIFNLVFPDVNYDYTGSFVDNDTMRGSCVRYQTTDNPVGGTWTATRKKAGAAAARQASGAVSRKKGTAR
jgi:hypothetical protein